MEDNFFPADIFSLDSQLNGKIPIKRNINSSDMSLTILKSTYHRKNQKTPRMWGFTNSLRLVSKK